MSMFDSKDKKDEKPADKVVEVKDEDKKPKAVKTNPNLGLGQPTHDVEEKKESPTGRASNEPDDAGFKAMFGHPQGDAKK